MSQFIYPINILSQNSREVHFKQLSYWDYKNFNKVIVNKNIPSICFFIDNLIQKLCLEKDILLQLTSIDRFYILLFLYGINLTTKIQLDFICPVTKKKFNGILNLIELTERIEKIPFEHTFIIENYHFTLPHTFTGNTTEKNILNTCLTSVIIDNVRQHITDLNIKEKIVNNIPLNVINNVWKWFSKQNNLLEQLPFFEFNNPWTSESPVKYFSSFSDTTLIDFIIGIYQDNLKSIYMTEFYLINNLHFNLNDLDKITPAEIIIYTGINDKKEKDSPLPSKILL